MKELLEEFWLSPHACCIGRYISCGNRYDKPVLIQVKQENKMTEKEARIEQCQKDIAVLQKELEELQKPEPLSAGDVVDCWLGKRVVVKNPDNDKLFVVTSSGLNVGNVENPIYTKVGRLVDYLA